MPSALQTKRPAQAPLDDRHRPVTEILNNRLAFRPPGSLGDSYSIYVWTVIRLQHTCFLLKCKHASYSGIQIRLVEFALAEGRLQNIEGAMGVFRHEQDVGAGLIGQPGGIVARGSEPIHP